MGSNMFNDDEVYQLLELVKKVKNFQQMEIRDKLMQYVEIAKRLSYKKERTKTGSQVRYKLEQLMKAYKKGKDGTKNRHALKFYELLDEIFGEKQQEKKIDKQGTTPRIVDDIKQEVVDTLLANDPSIIKEECDEAEIDELLTIKNDMPIGELLTKKNSDDEIQAEVDDLMDVSINNIKEHIIEEDIKSMEKIRRSFTNDLVESERLLISSIRELDKNYMRNFKHHCKTQEALLRNDRDEIETIIANDRQEMFNIFDAVYSALGKTDNPQNALEKLLFHLIEQYKRKRTALHRNLQKSHHQLLRTMIQERRTKLRQICVVHNKVTAGFMHKNIQFASEQRENKQPRCDFFWQTLQQPENEILFFETFRMTRKTFDVLCEKLTPHLLPHTASPSMLPTSVDKQVAITLYKLALGAKFDAVTDAFGIVKATARVYFDRVVKAISQLKNEFVQFPQSEEAILIANGLQKITKMPNIFGIINNVHFPVLPPNNLYYHFLNGRGVSSIVLQGVVDHNLLFRDAYVRPGSAINRMFQESELFQGASHLMPNSSVAIANGVDLPLMLIGDETFPLLPFLLTPYNGDLDEAQKCLNVHLNSGLAVVRNAMRRLQGRWRCLTRRLDVQRDMKVEILPTLITACVVLHNFVEKSKEAFFDSWHDIEEIQHEGTLSTTNAYTNEVVFDTELKPTLLRDHFKVYLNKNFPLKS